MPGRSSSSANFAARGSSFPSQRRQRNNHLSRLRRRRGVGRPSGRPSQSDPLRQRERRGVDRQPGREPIRRPRFHPVPKPVRGLPWRRSQRFAAAISFFARRERQLSDSAIELVIHTGKGRMSAFPTIQGEGCARSIEYLHTGPGVGTARRFRPHAATR